MEGVGKVKRGGGGSCGQRVAVRVDSVVVENTWRHDREL